MKKILLLGIVLSNVLVFSQDQFNGSQAEGVVPIKKRRTTFLKKDDLNINQQKTSESPTLAPSTPTGNSEEVGVTEGQLSVSLTGGATYSIPVAIPTGIADIEPSVGLTYNSQSGNGLAGFGWEINGVSSITRISSTNYHDGNIDGVDFNSMDRFALNGQRLLLKVGTGVYGGDGTEYETENYSNIKISSHGVSSFGTNYGPAYFLVEYPDGSKEYYGNSSSSLSRMEWAISYWTNSLDVRINYQYINTGNKLAISSISYGSIGTNVPINTIEFIYKNRVRPEQAYVGGQSINVNKILSEIRVKSNNIGYRNYILEHDLTSLGYERLIKITEKTGDLSKSLNPTVFAYENTSENVDYGYVAANINLDNTSYYNSANITGDFNGDGNVDIILYPTVGTDSKKKYWYFNDITDPNNLNIGYEHYSGSFEEIFPTSFLAENGTTGFKLMSQQGWCLVQYNESNNVTAFKNYSTLDSNPISLQYEKTYQFPQLIYYSEHPKSCISPRPPIQFIENIYKRYINGDFNGDGLTDVIVIENDTDYSYDGPCDQDGNLVTFTKTRTGDAYFFNLDRRLTSNYVNIIGQPHIPGTDKVYVADFNGDGKSDIFAFSSGKVNIYTLNNSNNSLILLKSYSDGNINMGRPILMGDYNGDGKSDFIIPIGYGNNYSRYLSDGITFNNALVTYSFTHYESFEDGSTSETAHLIAFDYNSDGKTDIVQVGNHATTNTGIISVRYFKNLAGITFSEQVFQSTNVETSIGHFAIPIVLSFDKLNPDSQLSFITKSNIYTFKCEKDNSKDVLLKSITKGNGLKESITYGVMKQSSIDDIYFPTSNVDSYPNFDVVLSPDFNLVKTIEEQSFSSYKKKDFRYAGAVLNLEGRGFQGFRAILKTNWYNEDNPIISNVSKFNINKRGAISETYSVLGQHIYNFLDYSPTDFITKSIISYEDELFSNKVYKIKNTSTILYNGLEGTSIEELNEYDSYNNLQQTISYKKLGANIQKTDKTNILYENFLTGNPYIVGRPIKKNIESTYGSDIFTEEELYTYNTAQLLSQVKRKGHNTNYITEDNVYDSFGNIIEKTISAQGLIPRMTSYEYDPSGRFLTKSTDVEGLVTIYNYDINNGLLLNYTLPSKEGYPLITSFEYDKWGTKTKMIDYLGKKIDYFINYLDINSSGSVVFKSIGEDDSFISIIYDDLGRQIAKGTKTINDDISAISWKSYEYDIYNKITKDYEPVFAEFPSTNSTAFSTIDYDNYGRVIETVSFTGKTTSINYTPLTTVVNDGIQTVTTIKDATGAIILNTDSGGTINYQYFANGNLKKSSINGSETIIEQDGWGRRIKLIDPSAGTYEYTYNNLGEMTMQKTPNGQTDIAYNAFGKIIEKTIAGTNTNSKETFTYDSISKQISNRKFDDFINNTYDEYTYEYDNYKRLWRTTENRFFAFYQRATLYDDFGRPEREFYRMVNTSNSKSSTKWFKNTYKNGYHWQVLDADSNHILWQTNAINERGQLTSANYGNNLALSNTYDQYGYIQNAKVSMAASPYSDILNLQTTFEPQRGNLTSRTNSLFNWTENFQYDNQDRLTHYTNAQGVQVEQIYEDDGRIKQNTLGTYNYTNSSKKYQNTSIDVTAEAKAYYQNRLGLFNDDMENQTGWFNYEPNVFSFDSSVSHSGITSFKINNTTTGEKVVNSEDWVKIDNQVPTEYTYSAWVKSDGSNPQAEIILFMKTENETGYFTLVDQIQMATSTEWVKIEKTFLVPANIKKLNIRLDNNSTGVLWFDDIQIRKTSEPTPTERQLNISYNTWKSPFEIYETGVDRISFRYNYANNRSAMYYGGTQADKMQRQYRKYYSVEGSMEIKHNTYTDEVEFVTYVGGNGYTAPVVYKTDGTTGEYLFLHRDYLGSIVAITDISGNVVEKRLFDAWGEVIKVVDGQGTILKNFALLDRGYTGHEHLTSVGLVHMNGRLYDAKLHRFLQPDNNIQNPYNSQNYNRYGYVLNNPLKYIDPSGENGENPEGGLSSGQQVGLGALIAGIANSWDELGIKDWFNNEFSNGIKSGGNWLSNNLKSVNGWLDRNLSSIGRDISNFLFGKEKEIRNFSPPQFNQAQVNANWLNNGFQNNRLKGYYDKIHSRMPINERFNNQMNPNDLIRKDMKIIYELIKNVKSLSTAYKMAGKPEIIFDNKIAVDYIAEYDSNNHKIYVSDRAFIDNRSYSDMAGTLFHEFFHGMQYKWRGGIMYLNMMDKKNQIPSHYQVTNYNGAVMEMNAYYFQAMMGDYQAYYSFEKLYIDINNGVYK